MLTIIYQYTIIPYKLQKRKTLGENGLYAYIHEPDRHVALEILATIVVLYLHDLTHLGKMR